MMWRKKRNNFYNFFFNVNFFLTNKFFPLQNNIFFNVNFTSLQIRTNFLELI